MAVALQVFVCLFVFTFEGFFFATQILQKNKNLPTRFHPRETLTSVLCLRDSCNEIHSSDVNKDTAGSMSFVLDKMKACVGAAERRHVRSPGHFTLPG